MSAAYLRQALGTSPVTFGNIVEGRDQTEGVIAVITAITQKQTVLSGPTATHQAHVLIYLCIQKNGPYRTKTSIAIMVRHLYTKSYMTYLA